MPSSETVSRATSSSTASETRTGAPAPYLIAFDTRFATI